MRTAAVFISAALVHFVLSLASLAMILPAAFETQGGNFWAAPGKSVLASLSAVLLAPLAWAPPDFGLLEIVLRTGRTQR